MLVRCGIYFRGFNIAYSTIAISLDTHVLRCPLAHITCSYYLISKLFDLFFMKLCTVLTLKIRVHCEICIILALTWILY